MSLRKYLHDRCDECPALFVKERNPHTRLSKAGIEKIIKQLGEKSVDVLINMIQGKPAESVILKPEMIEGHSTDQKK